MSSKHLRRLLDDQKSEEKKQINSDEEDDTPVSLAPRVNRFALMCDDDNTDKESDVEDDTEYVAEVQEKERTNKQNISKKKNKKKNKKQKQQELEDDCVGDDEYLDKILKAKESIFTDNGSPALEIVEVKELFKVDPRLFDPNAELKKALGKAFRENTNTSNNHRKNKVVGRIVKQKYNWPPPRSIGLSMNIQKEDGDITWFTFEHSARYENIEEVVWAAEQSMNSGIIQEVLQNNYYHLNSLLLIANMSRMQEDVTIAGELIEQGVFFAEQCFHTQCRITSWNHRIDYKYYENRAFYLLLHRFMLNCLHKRCFETALNISKLIFSLDPQGDPLAILLIIDSIALKARQYTWLESLYKSAREWKRLDLLPNFLYSRALLHYLNAKTEEEKEKANSLLRSAICRFPGVVSELLDTLQIQADSELEGNKFISVFAYNKEPEGLKLVIKMYVKQTSELWGEPDVIQWLEAVTRSTVLDPTIIPIMEQWTNTRATLFLGKPQNITRLSILMGLTSSDHAITDPEPPKNGIMKKPKKKPNTLYDDNFLSGFIHSLLPEYQQGRSIADSLRHTLGLMGLRDPNQAGEEDLNQANAGNVEENHEGEDM